MSGCGFGWGLRAGGPDRADFVSRVSDAAHANVVAGRAPADRPRLIAEADRALLAGDHMKAYVLLRRAAA